MTPKAATVMTAVDLPGFRDAVEFVHAVGQIAMERDRYPDMDLRGTRVQLAVSTPEAGGVTQSDVELANSVSALVEAHGGTPDHARLTEVEIAIDTMNAETIRPFWAAVLGYPDQGGHELVDPQRRGPTVWFQQLDEPRPVRNRIHLDVTVAHDQADSRRDRAVAAGGHLVSAAAAPAFWILADADGNEACISTWLGRD